MLILNATPSLSFPNGLGGRLKHNYSTFINRIDNATVLTLSAMSYRITPPSSTPDDRAPLQGRGLTKCQTRRAVTSGGCELVDPEFLAVQWYRKYGA